MAGKPSKRMVKAMAMIRQHVSGYAAAKAQGLDPSTVYRSTLYKEWREEQKAAGAKQRRQAPSPELRAAMADIKRGIPRAEAARRHGISRAAIYQSPVYQAWKEKGSKLDPIS